MDTKNYSLKEHLEKLSENDEKSKLLNATWINNWNNLSKALQTIVSYFPHFSDHGIEHTKTLIKGIEDLLGRERIEKLGVTDTFLILMSALTHDIGMYLSYAYLEEEWKKPEMKGKLEIYSKNSDRQISQAATLLLKLRRGPDNPAKGFQWAMEVRNAVTLIVAQQMRSGHPERSRDYLLKDSLVKDLAKNFYMDDLPERYLPLIADVAYLHGADFDEVLHLPFEENGVSGDKAHPRFVACMIRLGDLLDMDSDRFNLYSLATLKEIPESSKAHYDKHGAVEHFLNSPKGIEVTFDCQTDTSFRVACELVDMLKKEVEKQSHFWDDIAPNDLGGTSPKLSKEMVKFKGSETNPDLRNLRFDISGQRTFEMLKGGAIYENPGRVFIREIVQNALDATKLQIWKDMDNYLLFCNNERQKRFGNGIEKLTTVEDIKFPSDVAPEIYEMYPIHLNVEYDDTKEVVRVVCEDWGTGISEESLIRMTNQVGASRKADKEYNETIKQMPYFLQPTAAFGLGLQTVFYVTDEFTVETHYPGEPTRRIVFRSSVDSSYCSIEDEGFDIKRTVEGTNKEKSVTHGTTVTIEIGKEHFGELFEISDDQIRELEKVSGDYSYYIAEKIDSYVNDCFSDMEFIPVEYMSPYLTKKIGSYEEHKDLEFIKVEDQFPGKEHFRLYRLLGKKEKHFYIEEKKYGSILEVVFLGKRSSGLSLRGVKINDFIPYIGKNIMGIKWNLFNREADQLVTISRDKILPNGKVWCVNTLNQLISDTIRLTYKNMQKECKRDGSNHERKQEIQEQYFNFCVVNWNLIDPIYVDYEPLDNYVLKSSLRGNYVLDSEGAGIKASDLFKASRLVVRYRGKGSHTSESLESLSKKILHIMDEKIIIWRVPHIPNYYRCVAVFKLYVQGEYGEKSIVPGCQIVKPDGSSHHFVEIIGDDVPLYSEGLRYGFERYKKIVVGGDAPLLGFGKLDFADCWIYPFKPLTEKDYKLGRDELYKRLKGELVKDLVPEYIVNLVQKYNVLKNDMLTADEIYDEYLQLILDSRFGIAKDEKKGLRKKEKNVKK